MSLHSLDKAVVLAELGGYGDGAYCAEYGKGAALVMLGTYIIDKSDNVPYPPNFVFKPDKQTYGKYLRENLKLAKKEADYTGVSAISVRLEETLEFLKIPDDSGADFVSICAHSTMDMFLKTNTGSALCYKDNWGNLSKWAKSIQKAVSIPAIFKIKSQADIVGAVAVIADAGIDIVHINVRKTTKGSQGLSMVHDLKDKIPCLIVSGGIKDNADARRVITAGADAVSIGQAAMRDPDLCGQIQKQLRCV